MKNSNRFFAFFFLLFITAGSITAQEVTNRYSHILVADGGRYKLQDEEKIRSLKVFDLDNAPADMFIPYAAKNIFVQEQDYLQCTTKRFLYKKYADYDLHLEVDVPLKREKSPFIVWIHGGGWEAGDMYAFKNISTYLASHGIAGVRISYSLLPQGGNMQKAWNDIQDALKFVKAHADELAIDTDMFGFAGHSAGAHLSAYAAMRIPGTKLLIGLNGAYDLENIKEGFEPNDHHFQFLGNTPALQKEASPINFVHPQAPFCLLGYSTGDDLVDPDQVKSFVEKLKEYNVPYELMWAELYSHSAYLATDLYEPTLMKVLITAKKAFRE